MIIGAPSEEKSQAEMPRKPRISGNRLKAVIAINLWGILSTLSHSAQKVTASKGVTSGDCAIVRYAAMFVFIQPIRMAARKYPCKDLPPGSMKLLVLRTVAGAAGFGLLYLAFARCPISLVTVIMNLAPFWCSALAFYINGEVVHKFEIVAMVFCFVAVVFISVGADDSNEDAHKSSFGILAALAFSLIGALINILHRQLKDVHYSLVAFYYTGMGSVLWLVLLGVYKLFWRKQMLDYDGTTWLWIMLVCFLELCSVITNTVAFQCESSGFMSLLAYVQVFFAFLADIFLLGRPIVGLRLACSLGIFAITIVVAIFKMRSESQPHTQLRFESQPDDDA